MQKNMQNHILLTCENIMNKYKCIIFQDGIENKILTYVYTYVYI